MQDSAGKLEQYLAHLDTIRVDASKLIPDGDGTIIPPRGQRRLATLPRLVIEGEGGELPPDLRLEQRVGSGGMGEVHVAVQVPLARRVAVKRPLRQDDAARAGLVGEALVAGALEHPNIVPVHQLGRGDRGEPLLVMKLIEGTRWNEDLRPLFPLDEGEGDIVDGQLRVLAQVCNGVHFAHSMGVLHLDLKPDNVMLGRFGEVYVLDWGLAAATRDDAPGGLPRAREIRAIGGTPAYMAPEMAAGEGSLIDERTDVYLLGAVLHELITGRAPHDHPKVIDALASAFSPEPPAFDASVPRELAAVCQRAMRLDPDDRFPTVEALRDAVLAFLNHRASEHIAVEARERVEQLRGVIEAAGADCEERVNDLAAEARFGLRLALREWPDNPEARVARDDLVEILVGWHLGRDAPRLAAMVLREHPAPPVELTSRIEEAERKLAERRNASARELADLRQLAKDADPKIRGQHAGRGFLLHIGVLLVPVSVLLYRRFVHGQRAGYPEAISVATALTLVVFMMYWRTKGDSSPLARRWQTTVVACISFVTLSLVATWLLGLDMSAGLAIGLVIGGTAAFTGGAFTIPAMQWGALPLFLGAIGIAIWPSLRGLFVALAYTFAFVIGRRLYIAPEPDGSSHRKTPEGPA